VLAVHTFDDLRRADRLTFRTTAMKSSSYKERATTRGLDDDSMRELRLARLSRLVWVLKAIDRVARASGMPCVIGEAVFDSTSSDVSPNVLELRVPGALLVTQTDGTIPLPSGDRPAGALGCDVPAVTCR
jgi:hypothetical protein